MCNALYIKVYNLEKAYRDKLSEIEEAIEKEGWDSETGRLLLVARDTNKAFLVDLESILSTE